jgi:serine phosphatase RsbU (regulator of sigma subunit)
MKFRPRLANSSDVAEITLMSAGDILFLYTDGVYDGSDTEERQHLEGVMRENYSKSARDICNTLLEHAIKGDDHLRQVGEEDRIDDKTVFIIKRE